MKAAFKVPDGHGQLPGPGDQLGCPAAQVGTGLLPSCCPLKGFGGQRGSHRSWGGHSLAAHPAAGQVCLCSGPYVTQTFQSPLSKLNETLFFFANWNRKLFGIRFLSPALLTPEGHGEGMRLMSPTCWGVAWGVV